MLATMAKPGGCPLRRGGASTGDGAPGHGQCSVASTVSLVIHQGGSYDAAAMAQRQTCGAKRARMLS